MGKSSRRKDHDIAHDIELIALNVQYEPGSPLKRSNTKDNDDPSIRLRCRWVAPSSSSEIDYYTIERQVGDQEWLPVGDPINQGQSQTELTVSLSNQDETNAHLPSHFRLRAHLKDGQTFTSKPTDDIILPSVKDLYAIKPAVEVLSPTSVQLKWKDDEKDHENEKMEKKNNIYDVEKKVQHPKEEQDQSNENHQQKENGNEEQNNQTKKGQGQQRKANGNEEHNQQDDQSEKKNHAKTSEDEQKSRKNENHKNQSQSEEDSQEQQHDQNQSQKTSHETESVWEKVTEVPLSKESIRIDDLADAAQCEFRLVPSESSEVAVTESGTLVDFHSIIIIISLLL